MKYLFQFTVIGVITAIGELLNLLLPLPIPASIYGLILLFAALCTKIIRLDQVEDAADFFLTLMPILFVPPTVGLMTRWDVLKNNIFGLLITCIVSTVLVMGFTGIIAQFLIRRQGQKSQDGSDDFKPEDIAAMEEAALPILNSEGVDRSKDTRRDKNE